MHLLKRALLAATAIVCAASIAHAQSYPNPVFGNYQARVGTNAALKLLAINSAVTAGVVRREGYGAAGDGGGLDVVYQNAACTVNGGLGDNASQITASDGHCWLGVFGGHANLLQWGADKTGASSVDVQLSAAVAAMAGSKLEVPGGKYLLTNAAQSTLQGIDFECTPAPGNDLGTYAQNGATFLITGTSLSPFIAQSGWRMHGCNFFWPNQIEQATPIVYPPLFTGNYVDSVTLEHNTFVNAYDLFAITNGQPGMGSVHINDNHGFVLRYLLDFENGAPDSVWIDHNFWSLAVYGSVAVGTANHYLRDYAQTNSEIAHIDVSGKTWPSVDGLTVHNNLIHGFRYGVRVVSGKADLLKVTNNSFDGTMTPLSVTGTGVLPHGVFAHNNVFSVFTDHTDICYPVIEMASSGAAISTLDSSGNIFAQAQGSVFYANADSSFLLLNSTGDQIQYWNQCTGASAERYAYGLASTNMDVVISGSAQQTSVVSGNVNTAYSVNTRSATISGNSTAGASIVGRMIGGQISLTGNRSLFTGTASIIDSTGTPSSVESQDNVWDVAPAIYSYPSASLAISSAQTFPGAKTAAVFATTVFDDGRNVSGSGFAAPRAGVYRCGAKISYTSGTTAADVWKLSLETSSSLQQRAAYHTILTGETSGTLLLDEEFHLSVGDVVNAYITRVSGSGTLPEVNDASASGLTCRKKN